MMFFAGQHSCILQAAPAELEVKLPNPCRMSSRTPLGTSSCQHPSSICMFPDGDMCEEVGLEGVWSSNDNDTIK